MAALDNNGSSRRITFEPRITLGNLLTIFGGVVFALGLIYNINSKLDGLLAQVTDIRCTLAMAGIAQTHQVLCVTHLPQVAAQATCHLVVIKDQSRDRAVVSITPIQASRKQRVAELARMLGDSKAKSALAHAEELLGK
jgi:hypothetical protein